MAFARSSDGIRAAVVGLRAVVGWHSNRRSFAFAPPPGGVRPCRRGDTRARCHRLPLDTARSSVMVGRPTEIGRSTEKPASWSGAMAYEIEGRLLEVCTCNVL